MTPARTAGGNVVPLHPGLVEGIQSSRAGRDIALPDPAPFDRLTGALIVDQFRRGVLP